MLTKMLLYCTKLNPFLINDCGKFYLDNKTYNYYWKKGMIAPEHLNGKIVGECDFEVEEIYFQDGTLDQAELGITGWRTNKLVEFNLLSKSCLSYNQLVDYLKNNDGYAIHIKNLKIYDKPKKLREYCYGVYPRTNNIIDQFKINDYSSISVMYECEKAPKNMARVFTWDWNEGKSDDTYVLISVKPEELCRILNEEQTILPRKRVLKEML